MMYAKTIKTVHSRKRLNAPIRESLREKKNHSSAKVHVPEIYKFRGFSHPRKFLRLK